MNKQKQDYKISDLPRTYKSSFFDILKTRWDHLLILAIFVLIATLPLILFNYYNQIMITNISYDAVNGIISEEDAIKQIQHNMFIFSLIEIPIFMFMAFIYSGLIRIIKKMIQREGYFIKYDFLQGIKENILHFLIYAFLYGAINVLLNFISYHYIISNQFLYYLFKILNYGIFIPLLFINLTLTSIYKEKISKKIMESIILYLRNFPILLLFFGILEGSLALFIIPSTFMLLFGAMLYAFLIVPIYLLIIQHLMHYIFDNDINYKQFPSIYKKGLYIDKI